MTDHKKWIEKADADFHDARSLLSAAFHNGNLAPMVVERCRAAAEGYLKALLTHDGIEFPETAGLIELVELADLRLLPSHVEPLTQNCDQHQAITIATRVKREVLEILAG